jgi:hypothetical protein
MRRGVLLVELDESTLRLLHLADETCPGLLHVLALSPGRLIGCSRGRDLDTGDNGVFLRQGFPIHTNLGD